VNAGEDNRHRRSASGGSGGGAVGGGEREGGDSADGLESPRDAGHVPSSSAIKVRKRPQMHEHQLVRAADVGEPQTHTHIHTHTCARASQPRTGRSVPQTDAVLKSESESESERVCEQLIEIKMVQEGKGRGRSRDSIPVARCCSISGEGGRGVGGQGKKTKDTLESHMTPNSQSMGRGRGVRGGRIRGHVERKTGGSESVLSQTLVSSTVCSKATISSTPAARKDTRKCIAEFFP